MGGVVPETYGRTAKAGRPVEGRQRALLQSMTSLPWVRKLGLFCLFQSGYFLTYKYASAFSQSSAAPFWFPDSVVLCALLMSKPKYWGTLLISLLPTRLLIDGGAEIPDWFRLTTFLIDSGKGLMVAASLRHLLVDPLRFRNAQEYALFCGVAVVAGPALSGLVGAATRHLAGYQFLLAWKQWFLGNVATQLIVTPPLFYWVVGQSQTSWRLARRRWKEAALLCVALIWSGYCAYTAAAVTSPFSEPLFYAPVPFLFWAAVRFGMSGACGAIGILSPFAIYAAFHPQGLTAMHSLEYRNFLILAAGYVYVVAILIEQKKGVEQSLNESEARFRLIADSAPVMIWTTDTGRLCDFVNRSWLEFTGRTMEQERGTGWAEGIHPEDRVRCLRIYTSHFDAREPFEIEYRCRRHDGEYRWILDYGRPRYDPAGAFLGYIGSCIDVTRRRKQEAALRNSEERYREVIESQTELVCRYLPNTILTFVNEAFCRFFGRTREQVLGTEFLTLLPESARELASKRIAEAGATKVACGWECEVSCPGGATVWQHWVNCAVFGPGGALEEFQCIGQDITDRKRAEELARLVMHAQEEERKRIARDLHDDLNQRVAAHAIALSNLKDYILNPDHESRATVLERLDKLEQQAVALGDEIRMIAHQLHPPTFDGGGLEGALQALCAEFSTLTRLRIDLHCESCAGDLPTNVMLCCFRIVQEGLRNVDKHARASEVKVNVVTSPDRVWLELADDGIGLNGHGKNHETGLGLNSMRERVELLSGVFRIAKREPQGTVVTAVVPVVK